MPASAHASQSVASYFASLQLFGKLHPTTMSSACHHPLAAVLLLLLCHRWHAQGEGVRHVRCQGCHHDGLWSSGPGQQGRRLRQLLQARCVSAQAPASTTREPIDPCTFMGPALHVLTCTPVAALADCQQSLCLTSTACAPACLPAAGCPPRPMCSTTLASLAARPQTLVPSRSTSTTPQPPRKCSAVGWLGGWP